MSTAPPDAVQPTDTRGSKENPTATRTTMEDLQTRTISSPHELTDWVDNLLDTLQGRFDDMQSAVDARSEYRITISMEREADIYLARKTVVVEMSNRIDSLESSIEELIQGHLSGGTETK